MPSTPEITTAQLGAEFQSENIIKVRYPNDEQLGGKVLRLKQQYFFASCSLQDMLRCYKALPLGQCVYCS